MAASDRSLHGLRAVPVVAARADGHVGRHRDQDEEVLAALRRHGGVGLRRLADVDRRRVGDPGSSPKMSPKFWSQSEVKNSEWWASCGRRPSTPSIARTAPGPGERRRHACSGCVCRAAGSSAVSRWCRSAAPTTTSAGDRTTLAVRRRVLDPGHVRTAPRRPVGEDPGDRRAPVCSRRPVPLGQGGDDLDQPGEAALRVEHPVAQVEPAHQVVHARRTARRGAEEDRGIAQDLAQPVVGEPGRHVAGQRAGQQPAQQRESGVRRRCAGTTTWSRSCCRGSGAARCRRCPPRSGGRRRRPRRLRARRDSNSARLWARSGRRSSGSSWPSKKTR